VREERNVKRSEGRAHKILAESGRDDVEIGRESRPGRLLFTYASLLSKLRYRQTGLNLAWWHMHRRLIASPGS